MARTKLFITEHMNARRVSDGEMAKRLGCSRHTVLRARQKPQNLTVDKLQEFAQALGLDDWKELIYLPKPEEKLAAIIDEANEAVEEFKSRQK